MTGFAALVFSGFGGLAQLGVFSVAGLVAAGAGAGAGERRAAVLRALTDASLDPAALHLNPGNPEFDLRR